MIYCEKFIMGKEEQIMKRKKVLSCMMAAILAAGMLAGCGGKKESDSGKDKLTFWFPAYAATDAETTDEEFWDEALADFEKEYDCEVKVEIIPWDNYEEKYLTGVNSKSGPDVGYLYMEMFYDYIDMGAIVDIDSYFSDEEKDNYLYYDLGNIMGKQYALPVVVGNPRILVANMDVLNQAGIDKVPETWDELLSTCAAIKEKVPDVVPIMQEWGSSHYGALNENYWPVFWSDGGEIVDEDGNLTIDTEEGLSATNKIKALLDEGYLPESCTSNDSALDSFKTGEAAMIYCASSNALQATDINWDYSSVVAGNESGKTFVAADSLVLFNSCENKDLAAKLMKYVTSADVMKAFHEQVSEQPPITKDDSYTGNERFDTLFSEENEGFQSLPVFKGAASMYDTLYKNLQSMMAGEMTPEEVLKNTTEYYNTNLK